jgi:hypothetical protein
MVYEGIFTQGDEMDDHTISIFDNEEARDALIALMSSPAPIEEKVQSLVDYQLAATTELVRQGKVNIKMMEELMEVFTDIQAKLGRDEGDEWKHG